MQIRVKQGGGRNARFGRKSITRRENTLHIFVHTIRETSLHDPPVFYYVFLDK